jgi:hypothetical protein
MWLDFITPLIDKTKYTDSLGGQMTDPEIRDFLGAALGNVLCQARALGELHSLADIRSMVRDSFAHEMREFHPSTDSLAKWEDAAARWALLDA